MYFAVMNRIDRISAILIQLQSRKVVKASDIAARFNISLRTVYRDVKTLEEAGVPLIGEAGVGYSIVDGYRLPPVMFTKEEATAFLTAGKLADTLTDASTARHHQSAMYKVRAVLKTTEKELLEGMDDRIEVLRRVHSSTPSNTDHIQDILNSISKKNILALRYFAQHSQELTRRYVEPLGIFYMEGYWHLIGWCRLRGDYRDFRTDRIKNMEITEENFISDHPTLKDYIAETARERQLERVVINVDKKIYHQLENQKYYSGFVSEKVFGDQVEMTFLTHCLSGFARWFVMFAECADIVEPDALRDVVSNQVDAVFQRLAKTLVVL